MGIEEGVPVLGSRMLPAGSPQATGEVLQKVSRVDATNPKALSKKRKKSKNAGAGAVGGLPSHKKRNPILLSTENVPCTFYLHGRCEKGDACLYAHVGVQHTKKELCRFFQGQRCIQGDKCPYSHDLSKFPCMYFHGFAPSRTGQCREGDGCKYSHEPLTPEGRAWLGKVTSRDPLGRKKSGAAHGSEITSNSSNNNSNPNNKSHNMPHLGARQQWGHHGLTDFPSDACVTAERDWLREAESKPLLGDVPWPPVAVASDGVVPARREGIGGVPMDPVTACTDVSSLPDRLFRCDVARASVGDEQTVEKASLSTEVRRVEPLAEAIATSDTPTVGETAGRVSRGISGDFGPAQSPPIQPVACAEHPGQRLGSPDIDAEEGEVVGTQALSGLPAQPASVWPTLPQGVPCAPDPSRLARDTGPRVEASLVMSAAAVAAKEAAAVAAAAATATSSTVQGVHPSKKLQVPSAAELLQQSLLSW